MTRIRIVNIPGQQTQNWIVSSNIQAHHPVDTSSWGSSERIECPILWPFNTEFNKLHRLLSERQLFHSSTDPANLWQVLNYIQMFLESRILDRHVIELIPPIHARMTFLDENLHNIQRSHDCSRVQERIPIIFVKSVIDTNPLRLDQTPDQWWVSQFNRFQQSLHFLLRHTCVQCLHSAASGYLLPTFGWRTSSSSGSETSSSVEWNWTGTASFDIVWLYVEMRG